MTTTHATTTFQTAKTIVIKLGSAVLTNPDTHALDPQILQQITTQIAHQVQNGRQIIIVTSGAVAAGRPLLNITDPKPTIAQRQALAAVGQTHLMQLYAQNFAQHNINIGQMLLSLSDMENRKRYVNARYTLEELLRRQCIPIINENDTVTIDQLKFGDNDGLAAIIAVKMQAHALLLLSDVPGLYDANPKTNPDAKLIPIVPRITPEITALTNPSTTNPNHIQIGTGGMETKIQAARLATTNGIPTIIAHGKQPHIITQILSGQDPGTYFPATECKHTRREKWILSGKTQNRTITIDPGATHALLHKKTSLLPAGIQQIHGTFQPHDLVEIHNHENQPIARGIVNYSSTQLQRIKGKKTSQIEQILGAKPYDEVIHRDNLVILPNTTTTP